MNESNYVNNLNECKQIKLKWIKQNKTILSLKIKELKIFTKAKIYQSDVAKLIKAK